MKSIIKVFLAIAITTCFFACQEQYLDDLTGKYPPPTDHALTKLLAQQAQKVGANRIFTLKIATDGVTASFNEQTFSYAYTGSGNYISIDLVGKNYFLESGVYSIAPNESAKAGNYIAGYDTEMWGQTFTKWGTCFFDINNGAESGAKVTDGALQVVKNGNNYTLSGVLALDNGNFIRINFAGEIIYEPDPYTPAYIYSVEVTAPYAWTQDGQTFIPVEGSQLNKITVNADGAPIAYFEIVTETNPASLSGAYPIKAVNSLERAVCQGQYMNLLWLGIFDMGIESGSYLLDDAEKRFMRDGTITIADNGSTLNIVGANVLIQDIATQMQFGTLPTPENFTWNEVKKAGGAAGGGTHTNLFSASALDLSMFGLSGFTVTLKVATSDLTVNVEQGPMGATYTYAGSGQYISFDFSRDAGTLPAGTYNVVDNTTAQVGDCLAGYPSFFGAGFMGTFVGNVVNGAATEEAITGGTVTVTDGGFSFGLTTASGTIEGNYVGAITFQ
jgi:hypothetical protein